MNLPGRHVQYPGAPAVQDARHQFAQIIDVDVIATFFALPE
jgi:hypothetical protein